MNRFFRPTVLCLALTALAPPALSQEIAPGTAWHEAAVTLLDADFADTGFHARWEYFHCDCGDVLIRMEQSTPDGVLTGELVVVGGRAIVARGMVGQAADLEMMMQAPTLILQLTFGLLQRAIPGGPAVVTAEREITVHEPEVAVQIDTGLATGHFAAPWTVAGRAWPTNSWRRRFDIEFRFSGAGPEMPGGMFGITGGQDFGPVAYPLDNDTSLDGWRLQWISGETTNPVDPPAGQTLGELRAEVRATPANDP